MIPELDIERPIPSGINSIGMVILVVLRLRIGGDKVLVGNYRIKMKEGGYNNW
jgi:hypothetical protein